MYWGDFIFLRDILIGKSTSRMAAGSPAFHWAGSGGFVEAFLAAQHLKPLASGQAREGVSVLSKKAFRDGCC